MSQGGLGLHDDSFAEGAGGQSDPGRFQLCHELRPHTGRFEVTECLAGFVNTFLNESENVL
jgi:hypothetical protein